MPKGVVLIFGPSNYTVSLTLGPPVAAILAGNCISMKPSEYAFASEWVLVEIIRQIDPIDGTTAVIADDLNVARHLVTKKWDHVIFKSIMAVGNQVIRMTVDTLTLVTLELGSKNPAVVGSDADPTQAAHTIVKGRFMNSGQLCLASVSTLQLGYSAKLFLLPYPKDSNQCTIILVPTSNGATTTAVRETIYERV